MLKLRARGMAALFAVAGIWLSAQTADAATVLYSATINGAQETPPNGSLATGSGTFTQDTVADTLSINVVIAVPPPSGEIAAHIHEAAIGVPGPIKFGLPIGSPKIAVWNYGPADEPNIIAGLMYVNIHSNVFPGGEIRGQIIRVPSCGDGIIDGGETCDDGNVNNGDGCDSLCQTEPPGPNHYLCRQVKDLKVPAKFVAIPGISVVDQTGIDSCEAKKPFLICDPADKNGGGITDPTLHYCCYKLKCGLKPAVNYDVTDQFWNGRISTKKPKFLCNPCTTAPAP